MFWHPLFTKRWTCRCTDSVRRYGTWSALQQNFSLLLHLQAQSTDSQSNPSGFYGAVSHVGISLMFALPFEKCCSWESECLDLPLSQCYSSEWSIFFLKKILFGCLHIYSGWLTLGSQARKIVWYFQLFHSFTVTTSQFSPNNSISSFSVILEVTSIHSSTSIPLFPFSNSTNLAVYVNHNFSYCCFLSSTGYHLCSCTGSLSIYPLSILAWMQ